MNNIELNLVYVFRMLGNYDSLDYICEIIDEESLIYLIEINEIYLDIVNRFKLMEGNLLADAYENELLPRLGSKAIPLNVHLKEYIAYLRRVAQEGDNARTGITSKFVNDMFWILGIIEGAKKIKKGENL